MMHRSRLTRSVGSAAILGIAIALFLSGCGGTASGAALQPTASATPTAQGVAALLPQPNGSAELTWNPANDNTLTVALSLAGLAPANPSSYHSDPYPATLGTGNCQERGKVTHQLTNVTADQYGAGRSTTTIRGVAGGIPAKGWYIALHAPGANNLTAVLACANVINPHPSTTAEQTVKARLHGMTHEHGGEGAYGRARLELSGTTLTVTLFLEGLAPGSRHDAHIHTGSCMRQGPVAHDLPTIVADADGHARVTTTIQGVRSIPGNWYIHVHNGTNLMTQEGYQPITCGNVFTRS